MVHGALSRRILQAEQALPLRILSEVHEKVNGLGGSLLWHLEQLFNTLFLSFMICFVFTPPLSQSGTPTAQLSCDDTWPNVCGAIHRVTRFIEKITFPSSKSMGKRTKCTVRICVCWPNCFSITKLYISTSNRFSSTWWRRVTLTDAILSGKFFRCAVASL